MSPKDLLIKILLEKEHNYINMNYLFANVCVCFTTDKICSRITSYAFRLVCIPMRNAVTVIYMYYE